MPSPSLSHVCLLSVFHLPVGLCLLCSIHACLCVCLCVCLLHFLSLSLNLQAFSGFCLLTPGLLSLPLAPAHRWRKTWLWLTNVLCCCLTGVSACVLCGLSKACLCCSTALSGRSCAWQVAWGKGASLGRRGGTDALQDRRGGSHGHCSPTGTPGRGWLSLGRQRLTRP